MSRGGSRDHPEQRAPLREAMRTLQGQKERRARATRSPSPARRGAAARDVLTRIRRDGSAPRRGRQATRSRDLWALRAIGSWGDPPGAIGERRTSTFVRFCHGCRREVNPSVYTPNGVDARPGGPRACGGVRLARHAPITATNSASRTMLRLPLGAPSADSRRWAPRACPPPEVAPWVSGWPRVRPKAAIGSLVLRRSRQAALGWPRVKPEAGLASGRRNRQRAPS